MSEPTAHQRLTRAGLSATFADLVLDTRDRELAKQAEAFDETLARVRALAADIDSPDWRAPGTEVAARIRLALDQPAHDGGPTVQEATADDRAHWTNKHAGEGS